MVEICDCPVRNLKSYTILFMIFFTVFALICRFQNPIENGQHTNSSSVDVKIMNQRSHILYEQLKGFVQRRDMNVVKNDLPPKTVYVISVKLSPLQRKLYKKFLDVHATRRGSFFAGYQALAQVAYYIHNGFIFLECTII